MTIPGRFYSPRHASLLVALLGGCGLAACSSNESPAAGAGGAGTTGGHSAVGGASSVGGTVVSSGGSSVSTTSGNGGNVNAGGAANGGTTAVGGSSAGGVANNGGASTAGGVTSAGGASTAGGASNAGGASTAGGATNASGSGAGGKATGGASAGGSAAGGASVTGGTSSAAGATNRGGTSSAGTGQGGASGTTSCPNRAISLSANGTASDSDTADSHVEVDLKTDLPVGNSKRTIEFWAFIKSTDWVGEKNQIFYYGNSDATGSFGLDFGTPNVTGSTSNHATLNPFTGSAIRDDSGKDLGLNSSSDQWVHVAMSWDGTVFTTYVNGLPKITAQGSGSTTTLNTAQSVLMIGCNPTNNNCFNGYFAQFRVWNVARTDAQIKDNYNKPVAGSEAGLVAYLKFDDATGSTTAADSVTVTGHTAHHGTLKAATTAQNPTFITPATPVPLVCP